MRVRGRPVQEAIVELDAAGMEIVLCVHDELIVECDADIADGVGEKIVAALTRSTAGIREVIELEAKYHVGQTWADLKDD